MSDTSVTNAPPAPAPATEVPVNTNQTHTPNPVGVQAPDAPTGNFKGSDHRPESRREAIQRAFDRANNPQARTDRPAPKSAPKAAEARPGHNNPPEATDKPLDLRKRPTDQPRGDHGHFGPREAQAPARDNRANQGQPQVPAQPRPPAQQLPSHANYREPIQRMSERAKYDWASTPESVRADMHRMHQEFTKASNYYKADHEVMNKIRPYHELATSQGTTLAQALENYVGMEKKLRADPVAGLDTIVSNLNLRTPDGQKLGLRDIAYHVLNQTPEQLRQIQQGNQQQAAAMQIGQLHQQIATLQNSINQLHTHQQFTTTRSAVDQYADSHPRFDELGDLIENELRLGFDLDTAYRRAELLRPATHAAQTRTTSAQTRPVDKSIRGAPDVAPSNGASRGPRPSRSPREAVQNAMRRLNSF